jgi:predicted nucleic acid-binding Zn ribbon protein
VEQLIKSLPLILRAGAGAPEVTAAACFAGWNYAIGDGLRDHAVPLQLRDRTLIVAVRDAVWQKQLQTMIRPLLFRVNAALGQNLINSIELRIDPDTLPKKRAQHHPKRHGETLPQELISAAAQISDPELRDLFLGAAESCLLRSDTNLRHS